MVSRLPRPVLIALIVIAVLAVVVGLVFLTRWNPLVGWIVTGVIVAAIIIIAATAGPPMYRLYKFQKYFKQHEAQLNMLPSLMQTGRTQEALVRFEGVMKQAPDNAYVFYMRAFFLQAAGKLPEAMSAANKAMSLVSRDPYLSLILQQMGGQMGQPTTVEGFKEQLEDLRRQLEPRVQQMRDRREKAISKRKKKSR